MGVWKIQEWTYRHDVARAGVCRSGQCGRTMWQGWTMLEWTYWHGVAKMDNAGEKTYPSKLNVRVKNVNIDFVHPRKTEITKQTQISNYQERL